MAGTSTHPIIYSAKAIKVQPSDWNAFIAWCSLASATTLRIISDVEIDSDSKALILGDGQDASIKYNGTNLLIKANDVGTGHILMVNALATAYTSVAVNTTLDATHHVVTVDASGGARTITLPAASGLTGRVYRIKKIDSSANAVTVDGNASETIDGATTYALSLQYDSIDIICNGTGWYII